MDVTNAGVRSAQGGIHPGVVETVSVDLVEPQSYIQRWSTRLLMLLAQVVEQLVCRYGQITNPALEEVPGERGFGADHEIRRFGPATDLPEKGAKAAEVLLIGSLVGTYLGNGEAEHGLKVRGEK
jgi:hypothetical protein